MSPQPKSSLLDVFLRTWYLGFTSFGGPVVHFQIFHRMFVEDQNPWLDEQTVRHLPSAISQFQFWVFIYSFTVSGAFCHLSGSSRSSQHEIGILHSIHTGRIFGSRHVFLDLEVSTFAARRPTYLWALLVCRYLVLNGPGLLLRLFMVLEHLISTNSFCKVSLEQSACTLWPSEFLTYLTSFHCLCTLSFLV